jgi:hypothetical protein
MSFRSLSRHVAPLLAAGLLLVAGSGCDWLLKLDHEPPFCFWRNPADSSLVSGTVLLQVDAIDSVGVAKVEFYADGSWLATDSAQPFSFYWETGTLPDRSWHTLFCVATDLAGNQGFSDTIAVQVVQGGQRSVYHGEFELPSGYFKSVQFEPEAGDTLAGDLLVQSGNISRLVWLDEANYQLFRDGHAYTAVFEVAAVHEHSMRRAVPTGGRQYIAFVNTEGSPRTVWARFTLE